MNKQILLFLLISLSVACSNKRSTAETEQKNLQELTPEVLEEDKSKVDFASYSKRTGYDIIQQLFDEAVSKDEQLKSITERIEKIGGQKTDSLENYQTYMRNNQNYWSALASYANQLSDSTLKNDLNNLIEILREKHTSKISSLTSLAAQIESSERTLKDQEILMKIIVTEPMMYNYQRNKYPNIKTLESVKEKYDSLIDDVKPYAKIPK